MKSNLALILTITVAPNALALPTEGSWAKGALATMARIRDQQTAV